MIPMAEPNSDELKKKLNVLNEKCQTLEGKIKAWSMLSSGIVHNLNNILMGISGYTEILAFNNNIADSQKECTVEIQRLIKKATKIVEELSIFSKSGKSDIKNLNLNFIITQAIEIMEFPVKEIKLIKELSPDLWEIDANYHQVQHVLINFLLLAWSSARNKSEIILKTKNAILEKTQATRLSIQPGDYVLSEIIVPNMNDPESQNKSAGKELNLALVTANRIIKDLNGVIDYNPKRSQAQDPLISILIPKSKKYEKEELEKEGDVGGLMKGSGTVLFVDDDAVIRIIGTKFLRELGYSVVSAADGENALQIFSEQPERFVFAIVDIILPSMNGATLSLKMREMNPKIKILIISGHSREKSQVKLEKIGEFIFLEKPFTIHELSDSIQKLLNS